MVRHPSAGLSAMGYYLPPTEQTIDEIVSTGRANSDREKLTTLGFATIRVAADEPAEHLALKAVRDLGARSGFDLSQVNVVLYAGALATSSAVTSDDQERWGAMSDPTPLFRFPGTYLQSQLGIPNASVIGLTQLACNSFQATLRVALGLIASEAGVDHVLCVAADRFPTNAKREIVYNLMSDGACAAVVSRGERSNRILATTQITRGAYWDSTISHDQLIAAYFPLARRAIAEAVEAAGCTIDEIDLFIPHNLNLKSWGILAQILGLPLDRIYTRNIARIGHVVASDNIINYIDAVDDGLVVKGNRIALFVMGFGAHWSCTILEA